MNSNMNLRACRRTALAIIALALLGLMSTTTVTAQSSAPAPTVGEIVVDSYDCATGNLKLHLPVTNLPYPNNPLGFASLNYQAVAHYEQGQDFAHPPVGFYLPLEIAPYTGMVYLDAHAPSTNPNGPSDVTVTSIDLWALVEGGDRSETTFTPECGGSDDDLVQQLIAELVRILQAILNG